MFFSRFSIDGSDQLVEQRRSDGTGGSSAKSEPGLFAIRSCAKHADPAAIDGPEPSTPAATGNGKETFQLNFS